MNSSSHCDSFAVEKMVDRLALSFVLLFFACCGTSLAQGYLTQPGLPTFATTESVELGAIDVSNGNLHLEVPLTSLPQRGSLRYAAKLVYDSRIWDITNNGFGNTWQPAIANGGWRIIETSRGTPGLSMGTNSCTYTCGTGGKQCTAYWYRDQNFHYTDATGTIHYFPLYIETSNICHTAQYSSTTNGYATDASGYYMSGYHSGSMGYVSQVLAPDGTQVYPSLKDTNGNCLDSTSGEAGTCSTPAVGFPTVDTLNRIALQKSGEERVSSRTRRVLLPASFKLRQAHCQSPLRRQRSVSIRPSVCLV